MEKMKISRSLHVKSYVCFHLVLILYLILGCRMIAALRKISARKSDFGIQLCKLNFIK